MCYYVFDCGVFVGIEYARSGEHAVMSFAVLHRLPAANNLAAFQWEHLDDAKMMAVALESIT